MVNNISIIRTLLDFSDPKTFYFIQILKRRKENPDMKVGVSVVDNFYIYSQEDLDKKMEHIIEKCTKHNARAYINLNRLDTEKIAMYTIKIAMDYIIQNDYKAVKNAYSKACGSHHSEKTKRWLIDVDTEMLHLKDEIKMIVQNLMNEIPNKNYQILTEIPTKSGVHIITNPFNKQKFRTICADRATSVDDPILKIDIQDNSPTVLYIS